MRDSTRPLQLLFCILMLQFSMLGISLVERGFPASNIKETMPIQLGSSLHGSIDESESNIVYVNCNNVGDPYEDGSHEHPFDRILEGIESVGEDGTVLVAAGTYIEGVIEIDKGLILRGEGYDSTKILCDQILFKSNIFTGFPMIIEGFTIQGRGRYRPLILVTPSFARITIRNNMIRGGLGGIKALGSFNLYIYNNLIINNSDGEGNGGYGIEVSDGVAGEIHHNTIVKNHHGIIVRNAYIHNIRSNIIAFNSGVGIYVEPGEHGENPAILHNDLYRNSINYGGSAAPGRGDISLDPLFVNMTADDYYLSESSPCIDAGINEYFYIVEYYYRLYGLRFSRKAPTNDISGNSRPFDGDKDGNWTVDMGAFEFWGPRSKRDLAVMEIGLPSLILPDTSRLVPVIIRNLGFRDETDVVVMLLVNGVAVDSAVIPRISRFGRVELDFRLRFPETPCICNVTVYVQEVDGEGYTYNNYGCKVVRVSRRCSPIIIIYNNVFAEEGVVEGSGTPEDPYVIEGWEIDVSEATAKDVVIAGEPYVSWKKGIFIVSPTSHLSVKNVVIRNVSIYAHKESGQSPFNVGIVLVGVGNCRIENANMSRLTYGIVSYGGSHEIINSHVSQCYYNGISISSDSTHYSIINSTIIDCNPGIKIIDAYSFQISGNNISKNRVGILIEDSDSIKIENNTISGNECGILFSGSHIEIIGNNIKGNKVGLKMRDAWDIKVYLNNFVENENHIIIEEGLGLISFDIEGNYWSDYCGVDLDGDGVGETIYRISQRYKDAHPLVAPYSPHKPLHPKGFVPAWRIWATVGLGATIALMAFLILKTRLYSMHAFYASAILADITQISSFTAYLIDFSTRIILRDLFGIAVRAVLIPVMVYLMGRRATSKFALRNIGAYLVAISYGALTPLLNPFNCEFLRPQWLLMSRVGLVFGMFSIVILLVSYTLRPPPPSPGETQVKP